MSAPDEPGSHFHPPGNLQQEFTQELTRYLEGLPASLERAVEGGEGPVAIPPEQTAAFERAMITALHKYLDQALAAIVDLRAHVGELERRLSP